MYTERSFVLKNSDADKDWVLLDASGHVVGRLATRIAGLLRGKCNPKYTHHVDSGRRVIIINAEKIRFTGGKLLNKKYYRHTGHVGGLKARTAEQQLEKKPEFILKSAVKGMLPRNSLGRKQLTKLKIFTGPEHCHQAQNPTKIEL